MKAGTTEGISSNIEYLKEWSLKTGWYFNKLIKYSKSEYLAFMQDAADYWYDNMTHECIIRFDSCSKIPGVEIYVPAMEQKVHNRILDSCVDAAVKDGRINNYKELIEIDTTNRVIQFTKEGDFFQPDVVISHHLQAQPHFIADTIRKAEECNGADQSLVQDVIAQGKGVVKAGLLLKHYSSDVRKMDSEKEDGKWVAEVYRYLRKGQSESEVVFPDTLSKKSEKDIIRKAMAESKAEHFSYRQGNKEYVLWSEDDEEGQDDVPLCMADIFEGQVERVGKDEKSKRPTETLWLDRGAFRKLLRSAYDFRTERDRHWRIVDRNTVSPID